MRNQNSLLTICLLFAFAGLFAQPEAGMPSEPGKCYAKCLIPPEINKVPERVLIKEASSKVSVTDAVFEPVTQTVLLKEAASKYTVNPAQFKATTEQKLAQEAGTRIAVSPAKFETMTNRVITKEAPRAVVGGYAAGNMGEIGTLSTSAAKFETVTEQVLVKEAYTVLECIPARFESETQQKLVQEAYTRVSTVPAVYEAVTEQVLVKEAHTELSVVPAVYETVTERVLAKEAYSTISTTDPIWQTVTEQVLVQEASTKIDKVPAQFENLNERIQVVAASTRWEKRPNGQNCASPNPEDCLVWCLVEVPAQERVITKKVRKACATGYTASGDDCVRTTEIPATYQTRTYQKLATPAGMNKNQVEATYKTRTYRKLKTAATTVAKQIPATYTTRTYQKLVKPAHTVTVEVPARYETITVQKLVTAATTQVVEVPARYSTRTYQKLVSSAGANIVPCGKSSVLNVNFETGSAVLTASSMTEIDRLKSMLDSKSTVTAKLVGHTDNVGSAGTNQALSQARARAVYQALVDKGVSASRLSYEGMGEDQPVASNAYAAGRSQNRRTEFITYGDGNDNADCNTYGNISYQKLTVDATPLTTEIPARYETYSFEKLVSDASVNTVDISKKDGTITFKKLKADASTTSTETQAEYTTVTKTNVVKDGGFTAWTEVVCDADVTPDLYRKVQQALADKGYDIGSAGVDGTFGAASKAALVKFQRENNLPIGQLNIETLKALGIR